MKHRAISHVRRTRLFGKVRKFGNNAALVNSISDGKKQLKNSLGSQCPRLGPDALKCRASASRFRIDRRKHARCSRCCRAA